MHFSSNVTLKDFIGDGRKVVYSGALLSCRDIDPAILPYTTYEYMVAAVNSQGQVGSQWTTVRTNQALPTGVPSPFIKVFLSIIIIIITTTIIIIIIIFIIIIIIIILLLLFLLLLFIICI